MARNRKKKGLPVHGWLNVDKPVDVTSTQVVGILKRLFNAQKAGHGGTLVIKGNASSRCGISMKGIDIIVHGNVGHMSAFMAQSGNLVVLGDAGDAFGDSLYEAHLFVRGKVKSLGTDCIRKEMRPKHLAILRRLLRESGAACEAEEFTRYGSARKLYNFNVNNAAAY